MGFDKSAHLPGVHGQIPLAEIDIHSVITNTYFCDAGKLNAAQNFGANPHIVANARHALSPEENACMRIRSVIR